MQSACATVSLRCHRWRPTNLLIMEIYYERVLLALVCIQLELDSYSDPSTLLQRLSYFMQPLNATKIKLIFISFSQIFFF